MNPDLTTTEILYKMMNVMKDINDGKIIEEKIFDWKYARKMINSYITSSYLKDKSTINAWAGLEGDWRNTCVQIMTRGKFIKQNIYLSLRSLWATPVLKIEYKYTYTSTTEYICNINTKDAPKHWINNNKSWPDDITITI